jgi:preprotein translocase subunit SecA
MVSWILKRIVGSKNQREVKKIWPLVARVNEFEAEYQKLSEAELSAKTAEFKKRIEEGRQAKGVPALLTEARKLEGELRTEDAKPIRRQARDLEREVLDEILPEAFAAVKNACRRLCGREWPVRGRPYTWEMIRSMCSSGGIVLHRGNIAEMATGEGKTLLLPCRCIQRAHRKNVHSSQ